MVSFFILISYSLSRLINDFTKAGGLVSKRCEPCSSSLIFCIKFVAKSSASVDSKKLHTPGGTAFNIVIDILSGT